MTTIITDNITADVESTSYELKSLRDKIERQEKVCIGVCRARPFIEYCNDIA